MGSIPRTTLDWRLKRRHLSDFAPTASISKEMASRGAGCRAGVRMLVVPLPRRDPVVAVQPSSSGAELRPAALSENRTRVCSRYFDFARVICFNFNAWQG